MEHSSVARPDQASRMPLRALFLLVPSVFLIAVFFVTTAWHNTQIRTQAEAHNAQLNAQTEAHNAQLTEMTAASPSRTPGRVTGR